MKRARYISFLLFVLFIIAIGCRASASYMCGCEEHHHENHHHEHVCCHCPDHEIDCSHHDKFFKDFSCHFHFSVEEYMAQMPNFEKRSQKSISPESITIILLYSLLDAALSTDPGDQSNNVDFYLCFAQQWSGVSCSLRAPPVLV